MRLPFSTKSMSIPFEGILDHAEKVKECAWAFQQAIECLGSGNYEKFGEYRDEVDKLEGQADKIKQKFRSTIPRQSKLPVEKFQLYMYIKEQDNVLDGVNDCLNWISYRTATGFPESLKKDFYSYVDAIISPIEELSHMVKEAKKYFEGYSENQRKIVIDIIHSLRKSEHDADQLEDKLKRDIFSQGLDATTVYHMITLADLIGSIADHAENAGDLMRTMLAR